MPRLSDKHIAAIRAAAEDNDQTYGFGDVILLCDELQERRIHEGSADRLPDTLPDEITNTTLLEGLIKRVMAGEAMLDKHVLGLFNAMKAQGYFQTITFVDAKALRKLLYALSCPEQPHLIRELQATRGLPTVEGEPRNPIDQLIVDEQKGKQNAAS